MSIDRIPLLDNFRLLTQLQNAHLGESVGSKLRWGILLAMTTESHVLLEDEAVKEPSSFYEGSNAELEPSSYKEEKSDKSFAKVPLSSRPSSTSALQVFLESTVVSEPFDIALRVKTVDASTMNEWFMDPSPQGNAAFESLLLSANILIVEAMHRCCRDAMEALLDAMKYYEYADETGTPRPVPKPFIVVATVSPMSYARRFSSLPLATLDLFAIRVPLDRFDLTSGLESVVYSRSTVSELQRLVKDVEVSLPLRRMVMDIIISTRCHVTVKDVPTSQAACMLERASQFVALIDACSFVTPRHVREAAERTLQHRFTSEVDANASVVQSVLMNLPARI